MRPPFFALFFALAAASGAHAAHPLITDDTGTIGKGRWQLELFGEEGEARGTRARLDEQDAVLSHGLGDALDLQLGVPWVRERAGGMGDATLDLKWRFLERGRLSLGLKPGLLLPTGDERKGLGAGRTGWKSLLIMTWEDGPVVFHANAGYLRHRNTLGERSSLTQFSGAVAVQAAPEVKVIVDLSRNTNPDAAATQSARYLMFGAIWSVSKDFELDIGFKVGGGSAALDQALLLGATVRW